MGRAGRSGESAGGTHVTIEARPGGELYARPRLVTALAECDFYHSVDVPGYGFVPGDWDLRGREHEYLGRVGVSGKRVLEVGPASGFLSFYLEQQGAEVVAFELSPDRAVDVVPYARADVEGLGRELADHIARLTNAWWLSHRAFGSSARLVHGTVYDIPRELGTFDLALLGSVLLHVRDPFLALENVAARTRETLVVTDRMQSSFYRLPLRLSDRLGRAMFFRPDASTCEPQATWWRFSPQLLRRMLAVVGFEESSVTYHGQFFRGRRRPFFSVVGRRTQG